jgi:hypothetical protein
MKTLINHFGKLLLIVVFVFAISMGSASAQPAGRLVILRSPNFGWNIGVDLQIDGRDAASIVQGRHYHGFLPAGHHVLTVSPAPNTDLRIPTSTAVNIQPGGTYVFTAMWDSSLVFLRPSGVLLSPGAIWQNRGDVY